MYLYCDGEKKFVPSMLLVLFSLCVHSYSRHSYIADYSQGGTLPDGNPCWKDFSQSRNNRSVVGQVTLGPCHMRIA